MINNTGLPFFSAFDIDETLEWQMSRAEKYCLIHLLEKLKPEVSIEIGTFKGGSLQVLSHFSEQVYSIDISEEPSELLVGKFNNVNYIIGDSGEEITKLLHALSVTRKKVEFILIDGDHCRKAVQRDLEAVLNFNWTNNVTIILHDSFNPQCRKGMASIDFEKYPHVEYVDLDYITGAFWHNNNYREMWGGFAVVKINPSGRKHPLHINQSQQKLFRSTYLHSKHFIKDKLLFLKPLKALVSS